MSLLRRIAPRGLFWRSLLIVLVPLILLQGVVTYIFFERHWDNVSRHLALGLTGDVVTVMNYLLDHPDPADRAWMLTNARQAMQLDSVLEKGAILSDQKPSLTGRIMDRTLNRAMEQQVPFPYHLDTRAPDDRIAIRIQLPDGVLTMHAPGKRMRSPTILIFIVWMVGAAGAVSVIAIIFLRNQIRPIRRLAAAAEAFGKGRPVSDLKPSGAAEVRLAAGAFLEMQERIRRQITQRTEMLAGVSHDLRSPLTRIRLRLAMLTASRPDDEEELAELETDVSEMERMIDEYLAFARGQGAEEPITADLAEILSEVVEGARRKGGDVALEAESPLLLALRPNAIKRCITNLVENASLYGRTVEVVAERRGNVVAIAVEDDGPGIPEAQREAVFKPFYRLDGARNPNTAGAGLGLAIARDVARGHGGDISMGQSPRGGLRAELWLPV